VIGESAVLEEFDAMGSLRDPLYYLIDGVAFGALLLVVGIILLPFPTCLRIVGAMMIAAGAYLLRGAPTGGIALMVAGVAVIVAVRKWQARVDEKKAEELEASAERWRPPIGLQTPHDDES